MSLRGVLGLVAGLAFVLTAAPVRAQIEIVPVTSPGGVTAWLYPEDSIPIVTIEASFKGGAALDPPGEEGAVALMAGLIEEGAGPLDATGFAEAREGLAAQFGFDSGRDAVTVSAQMLSENVEASVDLLRSALIEPRFEEAAVQRVRGQILSSIRSDQTDPGSIASQAFYAQVFAGHPYARSPEGTLESVAAIETETLRAVHEAALTRDRLSIAVVGDITAEELGPMLDRLFGDLPAAGPELPPVAEAEAPGTLQVVELAIPQSVVVFGHDGIARDDPDFVPAFVLDHVLGGGGFGSRLTTEVREKRGLTYGIYTYLAPGEFGWLYMGGFSSANARVGEALDVVRSEWRRMAEEGVTPDELEAAKRYLTGAYPLRFDGNASIANQLLGLQTAGLGIDYVNERNALIEAVTLEEVAAVSERLLHPDRLTFVVVGQPEGVDATN